MRNSKGQFSQGNQGRPKGSKNKACSDLRSKIENLVTDNFESLQEDLEALSPPERVKAYLKLLEFVLPKQRNIQQKIDLANLSEKEVNELYSRAERMVFANKTDKEIEEDLERLEARRNISKR